MTFDLGANNGNAISIFVNILDDNLVEGTEDVVLAGSVDAPASFVGGPATFNILDDDCKCILVPMDMIHLCRCISPAMRQKYQVC